ncbi:MAG: neutral/alkaline non-lysosomal ceramidase N-terminal domain-containing protein [Verrucomicrobia bacterium]|nr:neutral/alkaline non-lysosomal ceramidase N-terminal domain-containing protein [Verrucomicrobiota bacterium]
MKPLLLALAIFPVVVSAATFKSGFARTDITPPVGYPMGGYSNRKGGSTGIHDPLFATVAVLKSDKESLAMVTLDLRSFPSQRVVERVRNELGIAHVMLCSSHNHSGPLTWEDKSWPAPDKSWFAETENKIVAAIAKANRSLFDARLQTAAGEVYLGHNRRLVGADGKVTMLWRNEERQPTSPVDPAVKVIRVSDGSRKTRAVFVNYACHGVNLGPDNLQICADWPGYMRNEIETALGNRSYCLFLQGGAGDINPFLDKQPIDKGGFQAAQDSGHLIAAEVLRVMKEMPKTGSKKVELRIREDLLKIPNRWEPDKIIPVGLITALIGDDIAISGWPGEPFVNFQIALADQSPVPTTMLVGYCFSAGGVWAGYFPTIQAAVEGGYGAGYNTTVAVGTGEGLLRLSLRRIHELRGNLKPIPTED